jgi:hypothetical protein
VIGRGAWLGCLLGLALACKPEAPKPTTATAAAQPKMRATVVTILTTTAPANKTLTSELAIADGKARFSNEVDRWRLFDFQNKRVVFVDELTKSFRTATFDSLLADRRKSLAAAPDDRLGRATFEKTTNFRQIAGVSATQYVIRMGRYERQLWIGQHPSIPPSLFALMNASQPETTPIGAVTREPLQAILDLTGYPLIDHSDLPYDGKSIGIERSVASVAEKEIPADWLDIPEGFRDVTVTAASPKLATRKPGG